MSLLTFAFISSSKDLQEIVHIMRITMDKSWDLVCHPSCCLSSWQNHEISRWLALVYDRNCDSSTLQPPNRNWVIVMSVWYKIPYQGSKNIPSVLSLMPFYKLNFMGDDKVIILKYTGSAGGDGGENFMKRTALFRIQAGSSANHQVDITEKRITVPEIKLVLDYSFLSILQIVFGLTN